MNDFTAPATASASGYLYQFTYALYRLFEGGPARLVGIETDDDVAELTISGDEPMLRFTQSKLSLAETGQPLGDRSRNLWHTLHIWLTLIAKYPAYQLNFVLLTNKDVPEPALARKIAAAVSDEDVLAVIDEMRVAGTGLGKKASESAAAVLAHDEATLAQLVRNIELIDGGKPDEVEELREKTIDLFHLHEGQHELGPQIYQSLMGMLVERTADAWHSGLPAEFLKDPFARRLQSELRAHARRKHIDQPFLSTNWKQYLDGEHRDLRFLRQIERLNLSRRVWNRAQEDYWGFYAERNRLRELGDVLPDDWAARNNELYRRWQSISDRYGDDLNEVYHNTLEPGYHGPLGEHRSMYSYFTTGNYHALANGEDQVTCPLHWHPETDDGEAS